MTALASSFSTSMARYGRSFGLWLLLLIAPIGARFLVAGPGATSSIISAEGRIPVLTSAFMGAGLGIIIATLLLPVAFIYLRSNVTRRQPWQVEEVAPASRVAIAYGRWAADSAVLLAVLAATTAAGVVLAYLMLPPEEVNPAVIAFCLWVIAGPAVVLVASLRTLFEARRWTRGPLGEVLYFVFWLGSIVVVAAAQDAHGFAASMIDSTGFMQPVAYSLGGDDSFVIGGGDLVADGATNRIHLDVLAGILSDGYLASRAAWLGIAALVPLFAGLVYLPHRPGRARRKPLIPWARLLEPGSPPRADPNARPARLAALGWLNLLASEVRLLVGRGGVLALLVIAAAGWFAPYSTGAGPAAMLVLVFAATAHAGRSEQKGLLALTRTGTFTPTARRFAFIAAALLWTLTASAGAVAHAALAGGDPVRLLLEAGGVGLVTGGTAIGLGALTRSATAPRLVLLIAWYAYLNLGGSLPAGG
ncbi:MAG: hypothetical protein K1X35_10425 [Caulobacteraceae bacterium]|nr:hypothetical protein [Caulobacteraceae bacterium]